MNINYAIVTIVLLNIIHFVIPYPYGVIPLIIALIILFEMIISIWND